MADFNLPTVRTLFPLVLDYLKSSILSCVTAMDGTSDTNIPDKAKRYNSAIGKWQTYDLSSGTWSNLAYHDTYDAHIADTAIHNPPPAGAIFAWPGVSTPSGYLLCRGQAVLRSTYANLYTALGGASSPWGQGDGSTTFNVPNLQQRFILGRNASGSLTTMAATGGSIDHTHSVSSHTHTVAGHVHSMTHGHSLNDHTHNGPSHTHSVPAHYHATTGNGANIAISASGTHEHAVPAWQNARSNSAQSGSGFLHYGGTNGQLARANTANGGSRADSLTGFPDAAAPTHTHANSNFSGNVGNVSSGNNGDGALTSGSGGTAATSGVNGGAGATQDYSGNTGSTSLTSDAGGAGSTGANNPPYVLMDYIIKT